MYWALTTPLMTFSLYNDPKANISYGSFTTSGELPDLLSFMNSIKDSNFKVMNRNDDKVFIPKNCLGINAKSKEKDTAKDFIKELLTEETQTEIFGVNALPINKKTFANSFESLKKRAILDEATNHYVIEEGTNKRIIPNEDDINKFISQVEELNVPAKLNKRLLMEAGKQFEAFQKGEISVDDAVNEVVKNLDLYLSE